MAGLLYFRRQHMAATGAKPAFGTLLKIGDGGGTEIFTTIAEVTKITPPQGTRDTIEATTMESPSGFKEFIKGLAAAGDVSVEGNYTSVATQDSLRTDFVSGTTRNFQLSIQTSTPEVWSFSAIITNYGLGEMDPNGKYTFKATMKITGLVTVA